MVFLVLTRAGYEEVRGHLRTAAGTVLWINQDIANPSELSDLRATGVSVTNFTRLLDVDDEAAVNEALFTIKDHHPNDRIWVER